MRSGEGRAPDAFELAVGALGRRERTVAELRRWLQARQVEGDEIEAALARLQEIGELDDERFARLYAEDKRALRGWGPERIRETLVERGIDRALAERASDVEEAEAQVERAAKLLLVRRAPLEHDSNRGRALAYLARRGFDYDVAYQAVRLAERRAA